MHRLFTVLLIGAVLCCALAVHAQDVDKNRLMRAYEDVLSAFRDTAEIMIGREFKDVQHILRYELTKLHRAISRMKRTPGADPQACAYAEKAYDNLLTAFGAHSRGVRRGALEAWSEYAVMAKDKIQEHAGSL